MKVSTEGSAQTFEGNSPTMGKRVWVHDSAVILGDLTLGDDVSIWPQVSIRADVNSVRVGARTNVQDGCILHVSHKSKQNPEGWPLDIGEDVTIGHNALVHGCTVSDRVLIGMGAILMDGVVVAQAHNGSLAHSSPIYVIADGQPAQLRGEALQALVDKQLKVLQTEGRDAIAPEQRTEAYRSWLKRIEAYYDSITP